MSFQPDMDGVIVYPAHPTNVITSRTNQPKVLVLHTPEEPADDYESTPIYFAQPNRSASTHYYADNDGDLYQLVSERQGAIANGVRNKPYPAGTDPNVSLNYQSLSIEIEGYAAGMHRTCRPGSRQWNLVVRWVRDRARAHGIPINRAHVIGHYEVADNRSDPGTLDIDRIVAEAAAEQEEDDMAKLVRTPQGRIYITDWMRQAWIVSPSKLKALQDAGVLPSTVENLTPLQAYFLGGIPRDEELERVLG